MRKTSIFKVATLLLVVSLFGACGRHKDSGDDDDDGSPSPSPTQTAEAPKILSVLPLNGTEDVELNSNVSATFSQTMNAASLNTTTFTLTAGVDPALIPGTVVYNHPTATFWPTSHLTANTKYVATITVGATNAGGVPLATKKTWTFDTGSETLPGLPVDLGTAENFAVLAKSGISTVPTSSVTGDMGLSPAAASFITGFALVADASNEFSTSPQVVGRIYAADYAPPTPDNMTTSVADMETAFTDAAGRAPDVTELGAGDISGMTLTAGVYKWGTGLLLATDVYLTGSSTDVFIMQIAQNLTVSNGVQVHLAGGLLPKNIFWQVGGSVDFGTTSHFEGVVLSQTAITLQTGATVNGRLLAQTAVIMDSSVVVEPN